MQPSTRAASIGSFGMASSPARMRIAKTDVDDQTSATRMAKKARWPSISHGIARSVRPSACSALFTSPTLSLNMNLNWKPTRIGENIIGNIISVRSKRWPREASLDQHRKAEAEQHLEIERDGEQKHGAPESRPEVRIGQRAST